MYERQKDYSNALDSYKKYIILRDKIINNEKEKKISRLTMQYEFDKKEKLRYQINVEKNVDVDYIEIPPLLIQPYVENAIWHGLMQKEEGGQIAIHLSKKLSDDILTATITDNGIGRKKAMEIKSKSATRHKSYGMKVTSERIALINQVYNSNTTVEVTDLYDEFNEACGTRVVIQIPI